jgi:hypothetical protein
MPFTLFPLFHPGRRRGLAALASTLVNTFLFFVLDSFHTQPSLKRRALIPPDNATRITQGSSADATSACRFENFAVTSHIVCFVFLTLKSQDHASVGTWNYKRDDFRSSTL